jgi:hypothetical protein
MGERLMCRCGDNIKMHRNEIGWEEGVGCIYVIEGMAK